MDEPVTKQHMQREGKPKRLQMPNCTAMARSPLVAKQPYDWADRPSERVWQPVLRQERQGQRGDATTCAQMPAVPNCGVVSMRLGANSRPAQCTVGAPVPTEQLEQRRQETSIL